MEDDLGLLVAHSAFGIALHQVDTFSTGAQGWSGLGAFAVPLDGGPGGAQDRYLRLASNNEQRPLVAQNRTQWAGSYTASAVTSIEADFINLGSTPFEIRLVLDGGNNGRYTSTDLFALPADGIWHKGVFGLQAADLTPIVGSQSLSVILNSARGIWFHHQPGAPADVLVPVVGSWGIDNIRAVPEPGMLGLGAVAVLYGCGRRRRGGVGA